MLKRSRESTGLSVGENKELFWDHILKYELFDLLNTSFFLGLSRIPLSSAAMATIPLQKELFCEIVTFCFVWQVIQPSKLQVLLRLDNGKHIHMLCFLLNYITWIKLDQWKDLDQEKKT